MAATNDVTLLWHFKTDGLQNVQKDVGALAGKAGEAQKNFAKAPNTTGWRSSLSQVKSGMDGLLGSVTKLAAGLGLALGFNSLKNDFVSLNTQLVQIKYASGKTKEEMDALAASFTNVGASIGATGAELAQIIQESQDLNLVTKDMSNEDIVNMAKDITLLGRAQGVTAQDIEAGLQGVSQFAPDIVYKKQLAYLREITALTPGTDEAQIYSMIQKSGSKVAAAGGLQGEEGAKKFGAIISTLGEAFAGKPREIDASLTQFVDLFTDNTKKTELGKAGISVTDFSQFFQDILTSSDPKVLKLLPTTMGDMLAMLRPRMNDFQEKVGSLVGNTAELDKAVTEAGAATVDPFKNLTQTLKALVMPAMMAFGNFLISHMPQILAGIQAIGGAISTFVGALWDAGNAIGNVINYLNSLIPESWSPVKENKGWIDKVGEELGKREADQAGAQGYVNVNGRLIPRSTYNRMILTERTETAQRIRSDIANARQMIEAQIQVTVKQDGTAVAEATARQDGRQIAAPVTAQ